ncbi:MAG: hypothetical protein ACP5RD_06605 [bacterium]
MNKINAKKEGNAIIYSLLIVFLIFMLALAIINITEGQLKVSSSKVRFYQKIEAADIGINIGVSYLQQLINSTPSIIPDTRKLDENFGVNNTRFVNISKYRSTSFRVRTVIFDQDVINYYTTGGRNLNTLESDLINRGLSELASHDNTDPVEGPPYLIVSEVTPPIGSKVYKISIVNLENFNRFAYFTNVELTPSGNEIWFLVGRDQLTGPVRTNSNIVRWAIPTDYYSNSSYVKPTFKGTFTFTGNKSYYTSTPPSSTGGIQVYYSGTQPNTEAKLSQIIEGGNSKFMGNVSKINLTSSITSEDSVKSRIWPRYTSSPPPTSQTGIFVDVDSSGKIVSGIFINNASSNNVYSIELSGTNQGTTVYPTYSVKFNPTDNPIIIYKKDTDNSRTLNISRGSASSMKVKVLNLPTNQVVNLKGIIDDPTGYSTFSGATYTVNDPKAIVLEQQVGTTKQVVVVKLNSSDSFFQNTIWVNDNIGNPLGSSNKSGGLSGEYVEPLSVIAKPVSSPSSSTGFYDIRIKGDLKPYQLPIGNKPDVNSDKRVLGLYADRIFISRNASLNTTGTNRGIYIYASIMALKAYKSGSTDVVDGYFTVEDYDTWGYNSNNILHVYGGIIQGYRGPVGTFSGSTPYTGFTKDYQYDQRFSFVASPNFPTTGNYITYFSKYISKGNL